MWDRYKNLVVSVLVIAVFIFLIWAFTPSGRMRVNDYFAGIHKSDDASRYSTKKIVEDSCRSMVASYMSDKLIYEQYRDSDSREKQSWAEQARIRANKTAAVYNEYILKNSYVWEGNIPADIRSTLPYI